MFEDPTTPKMTEGRCSEVITSTATQGLGLHLFSPKEKVRPKLAVAYLRDEGIDPAFAIETKAIALIELLAFSWLDQKGRPRREPSSPNALRVIATRSARRARLVAAAGLIDIHTSAGIPDEIAAKMLSVLFSHGGITSLVNGTSAKVLLRNFREMDRRLKYVVGVTDYFVRATVYPDNRIPKTIEDAKAFVCKWEDDCGSSKISKIWECHRLAAPYVYALKLERSFRPLEAKSPRDALDWAIAFVKSPARLARFLGHAAFAMDVLKPHSSGQRKSDFKGVVRMVPLVRPFNNEERAIIGSIDRTAPIE
jgi:hypothetical protein